MAQPDRRLTTAWKAIMRALHRTPDHAPSRPHLYHALRAVEDDYWWRVRHARATKSRRRA